MKDIIIFDTNSIRHTGLSSFLGKRELLRQLEPDAEFYIPELVLDEIKRQKKRQFDEAKNQLLSNDLVKTLSPDLSQIESLNIDTYLEEMQRSEPFRFEIIPCVHGEIVDQFRSMAILNQAPFNHDSDKGFKDACIYISVLKYLDTLVGRSVFFWGNDSRLKEAFEIHSAVKVVNCIESYHRKSSRFLMDEYFLGVLSEEFDIEIKADHITNTWRNNASNWIIEIATDDCTHLLEVESRQIVSKVEEADLDGKVSALTNSGNFASTHAAIGDLIDLVKYFSPQHIETINKAAEENTQINWLLSDDDVREFFTAMNA